MGANPKKKAAAGVISVILAFVFLVSCLVYLFNPWQGDLNAEEGSPRWAYLKEKAARLRQRSYFHLWSDSSPTWMQYTFVSQFLFVFYDGDSNMQLHSSVTKTLEKLANEYKPTSINFVAVPSRRYLAHFSSLVDDDFETTKWPSAMILDAGGRFRKFLLDLRQALDTAPEKIASDLYSILSTDFLKSYEEGSLRPYLRNEAIEFDPEDDSALKQINSSRLHETLLKNGGPREFFVVMYAPWCGHCRKFEASFAPIADIINRHTKKIQFFKIDATKNDIEHAAISFSRVPHVRFFTASNWFKTPILFDPTPDQLNLDYTKAFLQKHSMSFEEVKDAGSNLKGDDL